MSKFLKTMGVERRGVAASCLPLVVFLLTLCVVAGVKIVRSGNYTGTSGNGTRMCIYVHPEDCPEAERIIHL